MNNHLFILNNIFLKDIDEKYNLFQKFIYIKLNILIINKTYLILEIV